jgi:SAM-dependent methyltransferase
MTEQIEFLIAPDFVLGIMAWPRLLALAASVLAAYRNLVFDWIYRVKTRGDVSLGSLAIPSPNAAHGIQYHPTHPKSSRLVFESLPVRDVSRYVFVDIGSGKGRMLFRAAEYPFRKIIGVEFAPELHAIAQANIRTYRNRRRACFDIESVNMDAATFPLPLSDTVLYMFFPFRRPVMEPLLARLDESLERHPRDVVLVYMNPELAFLVDGMRHMRLHSANEYFKVYRSTNGGPDATRSDGPATP